AAAPPDDAARRNAVHARHQRPRRERRPQWAARHDPARRRAHPAAAEPDGACLGNPAPDRGERIALCRGAGDDPIQPLLARKGPARERVRGDPARLVRPPAAPMTAQLLLSFLLGAVLIYAFAERRRSPVVGVLALVAAAAGLYFVWVPTHATTLAELAGV